MPRVKVSFTNVLVGVALLALGYCSREPAETVVLTRVDTIPYVAFRDSLEAERLEVDGLRAKLAGHVRVEPVHIFRTDTLVTPPDTVVQLIRVEGETLLLAPLIQTSDSLWAPELHRFDIGACDQGWSWAAGELVCDRARLGHLRFFLQAGGSAHVVGDYHPQPHATAGLDWIPAFRSPWRAFMGMDRTGRLALGVVRSWNFF